MVHHSIEDGSPVTLEGVHDEHRDEEKNHPGGTLVAFADGGVRFVSESTDRETVRALTTIDGGESVDDDF